MKYKVLAGKRTLLSHTTSWVRGLRALLEHADVIVETGNARIVRDDGAVIASVNLDPTPQDAFTTWLNERVQAHARMQEFGSKQAAMKQRVRENEAAQILGEWRKRCSIRPG